MRIVAPAALLVVVSCGHRGKAGAAAPDTVRAAAAVDSLHDSIQVFEFAELGGTRATRVMGMPGAEDSASAAFYEQRAVLLGNAGPLAFIRGESSNYSCGAHGNTTVTFKTMDLPGEVGPAIASPAEARALVDQYRGEVVRRFRADTSGDVPFTPESLALTLVRPVFSGPSLGAILQFTSDACYACGDNAWSSYSRSVQLPARELPRALAPYADIPDAVRSFFRHQVPDSTAGWSAVSGEATRRVILAGHFHVELPPPGAPEYLVWWRSDSVVTTAWIRGDPAGAQEIARRPGIVIVAAGVPWEWRTRRVQIPVTPCSMQ
jgi:hypothetical protein